ncbi:MAG: hypothetical protein KJZ93_30295, partial [Caldilineaceae bacterium]|nr:hypothetical protein [Caldilineaceae bacterium]
MRITSIETYLLECPLERPFGWSQGWATTRATGLVKLVTDAGVIGWGEGISAPADAVVGALFAPLLLGQDAMQRNALWQRMFHALYNANQAYNAATAIRIGQRLA